MGSTSWEPTDGRQMGTPEPGSVHAISSDYPETVLLQETNSQRIHHTHLRHT